MKPLPLNLTLDAAALQAAHADLQADLHQLAAESLGWQPLAPGAYVHPARPDTTPSVVHVVGLPDPAHAGLDVLLLQG